MKNDYLTRQKFSTSLKFSKHMTKQFTNNNVYKKGKVTSLKNQQLNCLARGPADSSFDNMNFCLKTTQPTQEEFVEIMRHSNCSFCCLLKFYCDIFF